MSTITEPNYDFLLRSNLERVFNERDPAKRAAALSELFVDDPVMYEPSAIVRGRDGISEAAGKLLAQFEPTFRFVPEGVGVGHHSVGCLRWHAGPADGAALITGTDAAMIEDGRISRLWVLLDH